MASFSTLAGACSRVWRRATRALRALRSATEYQSGTFGVHSPPSLEDRTSKVNSARVGVRAKVLTLSLPRITPREARDRGGCAVCRARPHIHLYHSIDVRERLCDLCWILKTTALFRRQPRNAVLETSSDASALVSVAFHLHLLGIYPHHRLALSAYYFKLSTLRVQSFAWWASTGGHSLEITRCVVVVVVLFHIQNKP